MSQQPTPKQQNPLDVLMKIEKHLQSIRGMMQFFVLVTVMGILFAGCSVLLSFGLGR